MKNAGADEKRAASAGEKPRLAAAVHEFDVVEARAGKDRMATSTSADADAAGEAAHLGYADEPATVMDTMPAALGRRQAPPAPRRSDAEQKNAGCLRVPASSGKRVARSKRKSTQGAVKKADKDVALIATLLSHVAQPAKDKNAAAVRQRPVDEPVSSKRARSVDKDREVVLRDAGESLESLVSRCRTLGLIEGELCRLRICSGMWGKDPACPSGSYSFSSGQ